MRQKSAPVFRGARFFIERRRAFCALAQLQFLRGRRVSTGFSARLHLDGFPAVPGQNFRLPPCGEGWPSSERKGAQLQKAAFLLFFKTRRGPCMARFGGCAGLPFRRYGMGDQHMIETVFSESACGGLKTAQHYGRDDYQSGCIGVIVGHADGRRPMKKEIKAARWEAGERERTAWENAVPVGGNPADGFGLALRVGDIAQQSIGIQRQRALERLYTCFGRLGRDAALELMQRAVSDFNTVRERVAAGEALRRYRLPNFRTGKRMRRAASCKSPVGVRPRRGNGPPLLRSKGTDACAVQRLQQENAPRCAPW